MMIRRLGRSDLHVSELCLGTADFGWCINEETSLAMLDAFRAAGGNFVQTRSGAADEAAATESYLGRWLRSRGVARSEIVIASHCEITAGGEGGDVFRTASAIRRACEGSLRRMGVRYLDLLMLEWSDHLAMDEVLLAIETLVRAGLVRHFAVSGFPAWRVMEWIGHSTRRNLCRVEAMQLELSLLSNAAVSLDALALARVHRVGVLARAPLAGGALAGGSAGRPDRRGSRTDTLAAVEQISATHRLGTGQVALAWVLACPEVASVLVNPRGVAQLEAHLAAASAGLPFSALRRLDSMWRSSISPPFDDEEESDCARAEPRPYAPRTKSMEGMHVIIS